MRPLSRRTFLAGSAAVVLASCSDGGADGVSTSTSASDTTPPGTAPDTTTGGVQAVAAPPFPLSADPFTLGVASGDPTAAGVVLWTRLAPEPLDGGGMPDEDLEVAYDVAVDESFTELVTSDLVVAEARYAHSIHLQIELPAGWVYYRFRVGEFTSAVGRTRTAPSAGASSSQSVRFATASCQDYEDGFYAAHRDIAVQRLDFVVFLGDYIYEGSGRPVGEGVARSHGAEEPTDLVGYRNRYALYRQDPDLQAAHSACPWFVIWDDHEVENNYAGVAPQDAGDAATFVERRRQAYQAWWEHQPVSLEPPSADAYRIYRSFAWGSLLDISLLDGRQYRTDQACGDVTLSLDPACEETFDDERTMLGAEQEAWLTERLTSSTATWSVIAQQTVMSDVRLGEAVLNYDQWDGYPASRERIVAALDPSRNTVVLTGDIHFAGVGQMTSGGPGEGDPVAVEFVATSISSRGNVDPSVKTVVSALPGIVDVELEHRGYILHEVDETAWSADYRIVDDALDPASAVATYATFRVPAGTNRVAEV